jgi:hypothetical protein
MKAVTRRSIIAVLACILASCTSLQWVKPGATPEQAQLDEVQCQNAAAAEGPIYPWPAPWYGWRGWYSPWGPDPWYEESRLADFCIRTRGYALVPADRAGAGGSR